MITDEYFQNTSWTFTNLFERKSKKSTANSGLKADKPGDQHIEGPRLCRRWLFVISSGTKD